MSPLINMQVIFYLIGFILCVIAWFSWRDISNPKRVTTALFWGLFAVGFVFGDAMLAALGKTWTHRIMGGLVFLLALLAGFNLLGAGKASSDHAIKVATAERLGNRLFLPALAIPVLTVLFTLTAKYWQYDGLALFDPKNITLGCLTVACILSVLYASRVTKSTPWEAVKSSRSLVDAIGWALILPLMLAMLGGVFVAAKTGDSIQHLVALLIDPSSRVTVIVVYCVGMALFTMIMGNAFAAFPVMAAGIALPFLIQQHHANPAPLMALGMLSGYCGTLMTPMAANYNIVPAALLELKDKYQLIRYQVPTALAILLCNIILMIALV
ncbi:MAG: DUF979 domain-containing protein [Burkholderiales bacterium]|nr:DUF979 domain-containing protein [Burkholderiales bacterium]